jgi:molybdopterin-containing oxidoreductase family iron-sulfur binding subunit
MSDMKLTRRSFMGVAAAGVAIAPGLVLLGGAANARPPEEGASSKIRWGLLIDTTQCDSECDACVSACF